MPIRPRIDEIMRLRSHERAALIRGGIIYPSDLGNKTLSQCWRLLCKRKEFGDLFVLIVNLMVQHNMKFKDGVDPAALNMQNVNIVQLLKCSTVVNGLLLAHNVVSIDLIRHLTLADLQTIRGMGDKRLEEITDKLAPRGITLRAK